jgi:membrane-associated protein
MRAILDQVQTLSGPLAYVVIGALVFAEAALFVGFVLPGETAVLLGGVLASTGHLSLGVLLVLVVVAAIVGDSVGFEVGRVLGPRLMGLRPLRRHQSRLEQAQGYLRRRGGRAVLLGRWTAFLRAVMPALAGASRMHYPTFLKYNAAGGLVWGVGVTLAGYFAGTSYQLVATRLSEVGAAVAAIIVVGLLYAWHRHRRSQRAEHAADDPGRPLDVSDGTG